MKLSEKKARVASLSTTIENYRRKEMSDDPRCCDAMQALDLLVSGGLEFQKSLVAIRGAARSRKFISYGQVGEASGLAWSKARRPMNHHLDELCLWAHAKGWPLITAVVVEKDHLATGRLGEAALTGFTAAARRCGFVVGQDEEGFLLDQQEQTFAWATQEISP